MSSKFDSKVDAFIVTRTILRDDMEKAAAARDAIAEAKQHVADMERALQDREAKMRAAVKKLREIADELGQLAYSEVSGLAGTVGNGKSEARPMPESMPPEEVAP